jgi:hypothetical protein
MCVSLGPLPAALIRRSVDAEMRRSVRHSASVITRSLGSTAKCEVCPVADFVNIPKPFPLHRGRRTEAATKVACVTPNRLATG